MAIKLIADPHGSFDSLNHKIGGDDVLLVLGDVLDLVDWADISGILPEVIGRETFVAKLQAAFDAGPESVLQLRDELLSPQGDYFQELLSRVGEQYGRFSEILRKIGCRAHVIYGNGDIPELLRASLDGEKRVTLTEGKVNIEGMVFGFISGALCSPFRMPAEMDEEEYGKRLRDLGGVDVLCTHIPPQLDQVILDVVAGRPVRGSESLLSYVQDHHPDFLYHGHVHHPAQRELRIGDTRVVNVAYFKRDRYVHTHAMES